LTLIKIISLDNGSSCHIKKYNTQLSMFISFNDAVSTLSLGTN